MGFQHRCPATSPIQAELLALKEGLSISLMKGFTPLIIETDDTEVINLINNDCVPHDLLICSCRSLMLQLREPKIIHNFRERNKVAHKLARDALKEGRNYQHLDKPLSYVIKSSY